MPHTQGFPRARTTAAAFDPLVDIASSDILLWLEADKLALANGAEVTSWTDTGPLAKHAAKVTATGPIFDTNVFGTLPAVNFNGTKGSATPAIDLTALAGVELVVVEKVNADGNNILLEHGEDNASADLALHQGVGTGTFESYLRDSAFGNTLSVVTTGGRAVGNKAYLHVVGNRAKTFNKLNIDFIWASDEGMASTGGSAAQTGNGVSKPLYIGGRQGNSFFHTAQIALIAMLKIQSRDTRHKLREWAIAKYGL